MPRIGIVGGSGAVGQAAVSLLGAESSLALRVGARRAWTPQASPSGAKLELERVDIFDAASLERFVAGCTVVVNCAGPSYRIVDRVARAALAAGAHYVDVSGDDPVHDRLTAMGLPPERSAVLSAGVLPGVSTLLPRWLAKTEFDTVSRLVAHTGGLERCTPMAAADFLLSLDNGHGTALAAFRRGTVAPRVLAPALDAELPFFPGRVSAQPFLSSEAIQLAKDLGLTELDWYNVLAGEQLRTELGRLRSTSWTRADDAALSAASERMVAAAALDLVGRSPYQHMVFLLEGQAGGQPRGRTAVLRLSDTYRLTGTMGALATLAILRGAVAPGVHYAARVLDPEETLDALRAAGAIAGLDVFDSLIEQGAAEEGAL